MSRQQKTPQQRAQEQLDVATRAVKRLSDKHATTQTEANRLRDELMAAEQRRDYLKQHPDLKQSTPTTQEKSTP